ncbi:hypothetical protein ThidrDRAFT_0557 [Thiorhodococcus drewsii AZ1]|uniref:Uncharacterized protein n=1 Tax=Thiorhodococcus drewsii AZ1 TaxID=765913 RepID=G2DWZ6_9GAMM|nr:hypothetical protein ThidrDRAFT_0557 [Thiorhodococcus drewsii AZ1]
MCGIERLQGVRCESCRPMPQPTGLYVRPSWGAAGDLSGVICSILRPDRMICERGVGWSEMTFINSNVALLACYAVPPWETSCAIAICEVRVKTRRNSLNRYQLRTAGFRESVMRSRVRHVDRSPCSSAFSACALIRVHHPRTGLHDGLFPPNGVRRGRCGPDGCLRHQRGRARLARRHVRLRLHGDAESFGGAGGHTGLTNRPRPRLSRGGRWLDPVRRALARHLDGAHRRRLRPCNERPQHHNRPPPVARMER